MENTLAGIWKDVLKLNEVGVDENFFDLGGHSILLIPVNHRVRQSTGVECSIIDLFTHPTIRSLAAHLTSEDKFSHMHSPNETSLDARRAALRREWWKKGDGITVADTEQV
jgi:aryl carrier-like protein